MPIFIEAAEADDDGGSGDRLQGASPWAQQTRLINFVTRPRSRLLGVDFFAPSLPAPVKVVGPLTGREPTKLSMPTGTDNSIQSCPDFALPLLDFFAKDRGKPRGRH